VRYKPRASRVVAIVNGCFPREVHAEGEEKVEYPQLLPWLLGDF